MKKPPKKVLGQKIEGAYQKYLDRPKEKPKEDPPKEPAKIKHPADSILLPSTQDHPDILIASSRLSYSPKLETEAQKLGLALQNNDQGYVGSIQHKQALDLNKALGNFTLPPIYFAEFLNLLIQGTQGAKVYDGKGKQLSQQAINQTLKEIIEVRSPWRSEWLDAKFSKLSKGMFKGSELAITYHKFNSSGNLEQVTEPLDPDTLMEDTTPGINLENYVKNPTSQGLPRKNTQDGNTWYWHPREDRVAWFDAGSGGAGLGCDGDPLDSDSALGVRAARAKKS